MHNIVWLSKRKISDLQGQLNRLIQLDGVKVDQLTHKDLLSILKNHQQKTTDSGETFSSIFWQQQLKAASVEDPKGYQMVPCCNQMVLILAS